MTAIPQVGVGYGYIVSDSPSDTYTVSLTQQRVFLNFSSDANNSHTISITAAGSQVVRFADDSDLAETYATGSVNLNPFSNNGGYAGHSNGYRVGFDHPGGEIAITVTAKAGHVPVRYAVAYGTLADKLHTRTFYGSTGTDQPPTGGSSSGFGDLETQGAVIGGVQAFYDSNGPAQWYIRLIGGDILPTPADRSITFGGWICDGYGYIGSGPGYSTLEAWRNETPDSYTIDTTEGLAHPFDTGPQDGSYGYGRWCRWELAAALLGDSFNMQTDYTRIFWDLNDGRALAGSYNDWEVWVINTEWAGAAVQNQVLLEGLGIDQGSGITSYPTYDEMLAARASGTMSLHAIQAAGAAKRVDAPYSGFNYPSNIFFIGAEIRFYYLQMGGNRSYTYYDGFKTLPGLLRIYNGERWATVGEYTRWAQRYVGQGEPPDPYLPSNRMYLDVGTALQGGFAYINQDWEWYGWLPPVEPERANYETSSIARPLWLKTPHGWEQVSYLIQDPSDYPWANWWG